MMKRIATYILTLTILLAGVSCRKPLKEVEDYFPKIRTISAEVQLDGTVKLTGEIESPGKTKGAAVDYAGFCVSTKAEPKMLDNQLIAEISGNTFTAIYPVNMFDVDSAYYFRSWATNEYGYSFGDIIQLDSIIATPVTPPCTLTKNTVDIGGSTGTNTYYNIDAPDNYNKFSASTYSGPSVNFQFGSALTTGVYQTTTGASPYAGQVYVSFYYNFISGALSSGSKVYVNKLGPNSFEITICEAPWNYNSSTLYFNTRFVTPF